jgi:3-deoxy-manno-octulosonate cytidylyltransferase (CMP-KDO synthetase)
MNADFIVVIPARLASSRLARKALLDIAGKPMIAHTYARASQSNAKAVYVATDHEEIRAVMESLGAKVCMTRSDHETGTLRVAEVVDQLNLPDDTLVVNVQGDEPLIDSRNINQVAKALLNSTLPMATLSTPLVHVEEVYNPNTVKVVTNQAGHALYFSRATIPWWRGVFDGVTPAHMPAHMPWPMQHHIGIFAYRAGFLRLFTKLEVSPLETMEALEQLRALWHGYGIQVAMAEVPCLPGVDTAEDLARVRALLIT